MNDTYFIADNSNGYRWIDGDTFLSTNDSSEAYRLKGYDSREIDKVVGQGMESDSDELEFKEGHQLGLAQANLIRQFQTQGGFTRIVDTGETDDYGRKLVTLKNNKNEDFGEMLIANGLAEVDVYTSDEAIQAKKETQLLKSLYGEKASPYSSLSNNMRDEILKEGYRPKGLAVTEADYDPDVHYGVQNRDIKRTLENKANGFANQISTAWGVGWDGVKEGLFGYADALGQVTDFEMLENLGEQGVLRAKQRMSEAPEIVTTYKDVNSIGDGFQWALNNATMSAPYLVGTFGAIAAAIPVKAIAGATAGLIAATLPMSVVYAGQTWNEMEGAKGVDQFITASLSGVAMATLDQLGARALMPAADLLTSSGVKKLAIAYAKKHAKNGVTPEIAEQIITKTLLKNKGEFIKSLARMSPDDIAKFSGTQVAKSIASGAVAEGGTELTQESLQMLAASYGSDKEYSNEEIEERLINAGLAGSLLGGKISGIGNTYRQMKNNFVASDLMKADSERQRILDNKRVNDINAKGYIESVDEINDKENNYFRSAEGRVRQNASIGTFTTAAKEHEDKERGISNAFKDAREFKDYLGVVAQGAAKLVRAAEASMINMRRLVESDSEEGLNILAKIGQITTGVYHAGKNFRQYSDTLISRFKSHVDENTIAQNLGSTNMFGVKRKTMNAANAVSISKKIREFAVSGDYAKYENLKLKQDNGQALNNVEEKFLLDNAKLYEASKSIQQSYLDMHNELKKYDPTINYDKDFWYKYQGFNFEEVRKDPKGFKDWLRKNFAEAQDPDWVQKTFENIAHRGENSYGKQFSLVAGKGSKHSVFSDYARKMSNVSGFDKWASGNIFETLNKMQMEAAKEISTRKYFGEGGSKLDFLFSEMKRKEKQKRATGNEKALSEKEINQFAWYAKSIIDATHGNFNRIETPVLAAMNRYLTSWSIFAGLPLSAISSIPETAMVYFNIHKDSDFKNATNRLSQQITRAWSSAAEAEVQKTIKSLDRSGLSYSQNAIVDRLATGERDIGFLKAHETFFKIIGIKDITQFQRRMNAGFALDFIKSNLAELDTAPKYKEDAKKITDKKFIGKLDRNEFTQFKLDDFNESEMRAYLSLSDLGIEVDKLYDAMQSVDNMSRDRLFDIHDNELAFPNEQDKYIKGITKRQMVMANILKPSFSNNVTTNEIEKAIMDLQSFIDDQIDTATYRFVNERIQNPQAANRPLFFQDPHYQLMTQFNGFISTFTANVVPKLWNNYLRKGTPQVKYDAFLLIVTMIALGGASQLLKDTLKFGEPSPYLDGFGYAQRALYSSGVIGQYERLVDAVAPLYPERKSGVDYVFSTIVGEAGPTVRLLSNLGSGLSNLATGETERGVRNITKVAPIFAPLTGARNMAARGSVGKEMIESKEFDPTTNQYKPIQSIMEDIL